MKTRFFKRSQSLIGWILSAALCLAASPFHPPAAVQADTPAGPTNLTFRMLPSIVEPGQTVQVQVWVDAVQDLYAADLQVHFDPALLEVIDADAVRPGIQSETGPLLKDAVVVVNQADEAAGKVSFAGSLLNPAPPVSGSGALLNITFRAKANGTAAFSFESGRLAAKGGVEIAAIYKNASLTIHYPATQNLAPNGKADLYNTPLNTALVVPAPGVLENDDDPEQQPIEAILEQTTAHGTLKLAGDGSFTYTPTTGYAGPDSFQYRVSDGLAQSPAVTVTLHINGGIPVTGDRTTFLPFVVNR